MRNTEQHSPSKIRPSKLWPSFFVGLLSIGFCLASVWYTNAERYFYFWDSFAYHRSTLESLDVLRQTPASWLVYLRNTMQSGFSQFFTLTLAPLMAATDESRTVYITGIVAIYLLPCAGLATFIVNRITPLSRWQWPCVFVSSATLPVLWRASLSGYPDIGGITLAMVGILVITGDPGYKRWTTAAYVGLILSAVFLFRRHLVYCIIPLMLTTAGFSIAHALREKNGSLWVRLLGRLCRLALTTILTLLIIWAVAPNYFTELISTNFHDLYSPYEFPVLDAWRQHRNYIGYLYWVTGLAGLSWGLVSTKCKRWVSGFLLCYGSLSVSIWIFYLRYLGVQYNLHFSIILSVGTGLLTALLTVRFPRGIAAAILASLLAAVWLDRLALTPFLAQESAFLPVRLPPLRNPDYDEIKRLIEFMRNNALAPDNRVLVAASSQTLNSDMLTVGEAALFGRTQRKLSIMNGSHVDTVQPYSLRDMIAADWVIVADPFQHHLRVEDQGVVLSIYKAMLTQSPFSKDFQRVETTFTLGNGINLSLFKRLAPTAFRTQVETAKAVFAEVGQADAWTGPFMMGQAATGAEYYDARLITPRGAGQYTVDLEQVRLLENQSAVTLFVRLADQGKGSLAGTVRGLNNSGIEIQAELFSESSTLTDAAQWSAQVVVTNGQAFEIRFPANGAGILALHLSPHSKPAFGSPLGIIIDNLNVQ